eukprot:XP_024452550.1 mediator of RNA polymerase II transcription subunit 15a [Populus trichocarpa]
MMCSLQGDKIKVMKETYFPEINEMYQRIAAKLQQHDSHPQQPKSEQLEKLEVFKAMLERLITFLQVSKNKITPSFKEKLGSNEKHIVSFLNPGRSGSQFLIYSEDNFPSLMCNLCSNPSLQFLNCSPMKIN